MFNDIAYAMGARPQGAGGAQTDGAAAMFQSILPLIIIFAIFYFLLIRPQQKRAKDLKQMLGNLKKGDKVITTGGIYGVIEEVYPTKLVLKIAENVRIKVSRNAIAGIRTDDE